jgi:outer membrane cobalamin receptor
VGLVLAATETIRLRGSYGEGFRAPSLGELFFPFSGNPDLEPERSEGYELGIAWQRSAWSVDLVTFETRFSNLIDYDFVTGRNLNLGRARTRGSELELRYRGERWEVRGQWTSLDAENLESGEALKRRPDGSGSVGITFRPGRWSLNLTSRYNGDRPDVDPVTFATATNAAYFRHDLAGRWQLSPRWAPYLRVLNSSDEEYDEALGFPAPRRTLTGGVQLSF